MTRQQPDVPDEVLVITASVPASELDDDGVRGGDEGGRLSVVQSMSVSRLGEEVNTLVAQMEIILKDSQDEVGPFHFSEFEVSAAVTATGKLAILGIGTEATVNGGLKFVFKRK